MNETAAGPATQERRMLRDFLFFPFPSKAKRFVRSRHIFLLLLLFFFFFLTLHEMKQLACFT